MDYTVFINADLMILVAVIYATGEILKRTPLLKQDWLIPIILWGIAIVLAFFTAEGDIANAFVQGTLIAATAVFSNQVVKQVKDKRE